MKWALLTIMVLVFLCSCSTSKVKNFEYLTDPLSTEGLQTSMTGSQEDHWFRLEEEVELVWILGFQVEVLDSKSGELQSNEFLCHASLDVLSDTYDVELAPPVVPSPRLFTLSQGVTSVEFPTGFGLPLVTRNSLRLTTQVLNLNKRESRPVQYRIKLRYIRDSDLESPLKALFLIRAPVVKAASKEEAFFGQALGDNACTPGQNASPQALVETDSDGESFIPHWKIGKGREVSKSLITERLNLTRDVTCHFAVCHLHPTAESLELIDLAEMKSLFRSEVRQSGSQLGISEIPLYSSQEGLELKADRNYGLVSVYNNQSGKELDAMAVMYLYVHDPTYQVPTKGEIAIPIPGESRLLSRETGRSRFQVDLPLVLVTAFYTDTFGEAPFIENGIRSWQRGQAQLMIWSSGSERTELQIRTTVGSGERPER